MLLRGGERASALRVVGKAMRLNWAWPMMVPVWAAHRALRRDSFF
jgi:hypothetical protein